MNFRIQPDGCGMKFIPQGALPCTPKKMQKSVISDHPVRYLLERGANVTLNCDNMTFARTDLSNEHAQLRQIGVEVRTLKECTMRAVNAAFCTPELKEQLREEAKRIMGM